jgi:hypothetical protein
MKTIAFPVEINLLYPDYEPFGSQTTRAWTKILFCKTHAKAKKAAQRLEEARQSLPDKDLIEIRRPFPKGVVHKGKLLDPVPRQEAITKRLRRLTGKKP